MYHKLLLITEMLFNDNPKAYGKILLVFCRENQCDADCRLWCLTCCTLL